MARFYKANINITHDKEMFNYLRNHFQYYTLNSWNGLKSIANNVKLYNLDLEGDIWNANASLELYGYEVITEMINEWEEKHPGYSVGFNGRSSGYLMLCNTDNAKNILPEYIEDSTYEEYKAYCKDAYGSVEAARNDLVQLVNLVRDFDKLCDKLRDYTNELSKSDFTQTALETVVDSFNLTFGDEMKVLELEEPEVIEGHRIKVDPAFNDYCKSLSFELCDALIHIGLNYVVNSKESTIDVLDDNQ